MKELEILNFENHEIRRGCMEDGKPAISSVDLCTWIGVTKDNHSRTMAFINPKYRGSFKLTTPGGMQDIPAIDRCGALQFFADSRILKRITDKKKLEDVQRFQDWIFETALPEKIQEEFEKSQNPLMDHETALVKLREVTDIALDAIRVNKILRKELTEAQPKLEVYADFIAADNTASWRVFSAALEVGRNNLLKLLRKYSVLDRRNIPYIQFINEGYFNVIEVPVEMGSKGINTIPTAQVTPRGQEYIARRFNREIEGLRSKHNKKKCNQKNEQGDLEL